MPRRLSIRFKLPLLICGLLAAVIGTLAWGAYDEARRSALFAAGERLRTVTGQLRNQIEGQARQRLAEVRELAAHRLVHAYFASGSPRSGRAALDSLERLSRSTGTVAAVELWDSLGTRLLAAVETLPPVDTADARLLRRAAGLPAGAAVGPLEVIGDSLLYAVAGAVSLGERVLGYVVQRRRVVPRAADQVAELIGSDASLFLGNASGDVWTDFTTKAPAPPIDVAGSTGVLAYERPGRGRRLATAASVGAAPWILLIEFPRDPVLARARAFLGRIIIIALLLLAASAAVAWALSRHITGPLNELTAAAAAITAGSAGPRVRVDRDDELGRLAAAFNSMASQVADIQRHLEDQVTARTRELRAKEERLRTVTDTAHDAIVSADHLGQIVYWNPGAERIFGYSPDEALGQPLTLLMPERYHDAHRRGLARFVTTREPHVVGRTVELAGRRKDGTEFPLELSLAASGAGDPTFTGIIRDITERRASEHSTAQLAAIVESADDAIISKTLDGIILSWNPGAERLYGYRADEAVGRSVTMLVPPDRPDELPALLARLARNESIPNYETVRVRKDGTQIRVFVTISPIRDATGRVVAASSIARDVTERHRLEAAVHESNAELEAFTYTVSHDLRAPLRAMQGFAQALVEDYGPKLDVKAQDFCRRIVNAATRMDELIQDLLAYSRLARTELSVVPVSLEAATRDAVAQLDGVAKDRGAELTVEKRLPAVMGHHQTLVQALANLIGNGIKFVAPETGPRVRVWAERRAGLVRIWVEDNGIGIAPEHQDRIFRVFERLHRVERYPGTGIGLAMVKRGIERMGGRVGVISNPRSGSRFWIDLRAEGPA